VTKSSTKGFANKAKSGAKALAARWRQAAERARIERRRATRLRGR
jgi:hypothetical protein